MAWTRKFCGFVRKCASSTTRSPLMKFLGLSLAVAAFGVMSFFNAPAVYTAGPEQSVIAALQSPSGEAWLASMLAGLTRSTSVLEAIP
jgi:hypothetical protein